jgi:predicted phage replisome organizer
MADVKWIKITTDVFDDDKILLIESLPEADSIIVIWFKLLCLAGKQNNSGVFIMGERIAYTDQMLATIFRRKESTVQLALQTFEQFGMIERIDGVITIPNWGKHQNLDQIESKKEYMKKYMQEYRAKQKLISKGEKPDGKVNCKTNSKSNVSSVDKSRVDKIRKDKSRVDVVVGEDDDESDNNNVDKPVDNSDFGEVINKGVDNSSFELMGGSLGKGVVLLTEEQRDALLDKLGLDAFNHYVNKLATFIIEKNATVGNHYKTILKWWEEDKKL